MLHRHLVDMLKHTLRSKASSITVSLTLFLAKYEIVASAVQILYNAEDEEQVQALGKHKIL